MKRAPAKQTPRDACAHAARRPLQLHGRLGNSSVACRTGRSARLAVRVLAADLGEDSKSKTTQKHERSILGVEEQRQIALAEMAHRFQDGRTIVPRRIDQS